MFLTNKSVSPTIGYGRCLPFDTSISRWAVFWRVARRSRHASGNGNSSYSTDYFRERNGDQAYSFYFFVKRPFLPPLPSFLLFLRRLRTWSSTFSLCKPMRFDNFQTDIYLQFSTNREYATIGKMMLDTQWLAGGILISLGISQVYQTSTNLSDECSTYWNWCTLAWSNRWITNGNGK